MKRLRFVVSAALILACMVTWAVAFMGDRAVSAQSSGTFAVTSIVRSCDANELLVNVENTTGQSWSLDVGFYNSSNNSNSQVSAGDQGLSGLATVPHSGEPFDEVKLDIRLSDGWRYSYGSFVGLCGESLVPEFQGSWPPVPQVDIVISNASCASFDWFVSSTQPVRLEIGVIKPAAAGDFPIQVVDFEGGETSGTFVPGVDWPSMLLYVRAYSQVAPGEFEIQADQTILIEDCAAVAPTVPPSVPAETPSPTEPAVGSTVTIMVTMPDGSSIEGAPWALYAPVASMQLGGAYATGVVGPNNTIVINNVPDGGYVLVISPEGRDPISVAVEVVGGADGAQVIPVNLAAPTETPRVTDPVGTTTPVATTALATYTPDASASAGSNQVSTLPNTGSGEHSTGSWLITSAAMAVLLSASGAVACRGFERR